MRHAEEQDAWERPTQRSYRKDGWGIKFGVCVALRFMSPERDAPADATFFHIFLRWLGKGVLGGCWQQVKGGRNGSNGGCGSACLSVLIMMIFTIVIAMVITIIIRMITAVAIIVSTMTMTLLAMTIMLRTIVMVVMVMAMDM